MNVIGIVTWYKSNFGSSLQAYALSKTLEQYDCKAEYINVSNGFFYVLKRRMRNILFHVIYYKSAKTRDRIDRFVDCNLAQSPLISYRDLARYSEKYAAVICGSDQIWSCVHGVDPLYFLQFVPEKKRIAYAPSIGLNIIRDDLQPAFKQYVSQIPALSVREEKGKEVIRNLVGIDAKVVLDPTFLLTREEWLNLASCEKCSDYGLKANEYILCYFLGRDTVYEKYVSHLQQLTGKKVVYVSFKRKKYKKQMICSVEGFLTLISNAAYVLTDSFHGTALSLNLQKKVAVFERFIEGDYMNQNSRIYNILAKLDATTFLTDPGENPQKLINRFEHWEKINILLEEERKDSREYLKKSLDSIYICKENK